MGGWHLLYLIILAIGAVQGVVMGILLWSKKSTFFSRNRFLACLLFFFSYRLIAECLAILGYLSVDNLSYHFFIEINWIYGGLLYFYVRAYLKPQRRLRSSDAIHLLPLVIEFVISNYVKSQNFYWDGTVESLSWLGSQAYVLWNHTPFQIIVFGGLMIDYGWYASRLLQEASSTSTDKREMRWLQWTVYAYIGFSLIAICSAAVDYLFFDYAFRPFYVYPLYVGIALITYGFGLQGVMHRNAGLKKSSKVDIEGLVDVEAKVATLQQVMDEDRLYTNPTLSLNELAEAIAVKPYVLTQILNAAVGKSFNDFVNEYRVEEVKRLMQEPAYAHYTFTALAFEAGFNSKATFNRIFRKLTGKTPGQIKDELSAG